MTDEHGPTNNVQRCNDDKIYAFAGLPRVFMRELFKKTMRVLANREAAGLILNLIVGI